MYFLLKNYILSINNIATKVILLTIEIFQIKNFALC